MFLSEMLEVLEVCDLKQLEPLIPRLFKRITSCGLGNQLAVANKTLIIFEHFLGKLKVFKK